VLPLHAGTESLRTLRWRETDSNFRFRATATSVIATVRIRLTAGARRIRTRGPTCDGHCFETASCRLRVTVPIPPKGTAFRSEARVRISLSPENQERTASCGERFDGSVVVARWPYNRAPEYRLSRSLVQKSLAVLFPQHGVFISTG
jgi:hypothetical protein